jgi:hypothetical protein
MINPNKMPTTRSLAIESEGSIANELRWMRQKATAICTPKYDKRGLEVMNQEAKAVTTTKRMVNPAIESRQGLKREDHGQ